MDLPLGALCGDCRTDIRRRARRIARRSALVAVLLYGLWVVWRVPADPTVRLVAGGAALMTWLIVYTIAFRAAREWLASRP